MTFIKIHNAFVILMFFISFQSFSQVKVELLHANNWKGVMVNGELVDKLKGEVSLNHDGTRIYCDSAYLYKKDNRIEAFGRVRILGDSTTITAGKGSYNGNTKQAILKNNVVFKQKKGISLYTQSLNYDNLRKIADYQNGGKIVDSTNVLTSKRGYYNETSRMASFAKDVVGESQDMTMKSDTMQYNAYTKIVYFRSSTELVDKENNVARYETGYYNTVSKKSSLRSGEFETKEYFLEANDLNLDDKSKVYEANGNVLMTSKKENIYITGERALYNQERGSTKVYDNSLMKRVMSEGDTLYLKADTLMSIERHDSLGGNLLLAYPKVSIYKSDLQGKADSLVYQSIDSTLHFFKDPILWTKGSQLIADTMLINIINGTIDKLTMTNQGFIISKDSIKNYNQIKGREMVTQFKEGQISRVDVSGNGESIYFIVEEDYETLTGMNKVICSNMIIRFKNNMVHKITFLVSPDGNVIPPREISSENMYLKGFKWRESEAPNLEFMVGPAHKTELKK